MKRLRSGLGMLAAAALTAATLAPRAAAQELTRMALAQLQPSDAGDTFMSLPSPWVGGHLGYRAMLTFDYAKDPLALQDTRGVRVATVVTAQALLHLNASFSLYDRALVSVGLPLGVAQAGDDQSINGQRIAAPHHGGQGDLRFGARGRIWGEHDDPIQVGAGGYLFLPTGQSANYLGEGSVYGAPQVYLGGRVSFMVWSATAGVMLRASSNPHSFTYGIGAAGLLLDEQLQVGPEILGSVALDSEPLLTNNQAVIARGSSVNAEALIAARYRLLDDFVAGLATGAGLAQGVGTPQLRMLGSFAYAPERARVSRHDRDGDRIVDRDDACPDRPGVRSADPGRHGCPPDADGDGIVDPDDACPTVAGIASDDPPRNGCPPDSDGDGFADADDACPRVQGVASSDPGKRGCPADRDGDGFIDPIDACPTVAGVASDDPRRNGCPFDSDGDGFGDTIDACPTEPGVDNADPSKRGCPQVQLTEGRIVINRNIEFETDQATIRPVSDDLLDQIARMLAEHPEIRQIEIQGHTDDVGPRARNMTLSTERANAVRTALTRRGIRPWRLRTQGYGQDVPLVPNDSAENRQKNRRVELKILEREPR